jgi:hypothetical protein
MSHSCIRNKFDPCGVLLHIGCAKKKFPKAYVDIFSFTGKSQRTDFNQQETENILSIKTMVHSLNGALNVWVP